MKSTKMLFLITLIGGLIILFIGIYLQISNQMSEGYFYSKYRYGNNTAYSQTINGFTGICLGIFVLFLSIFAFYNYRKEKKKWKEMEEDEQ
ncbi:MAG: hypothetical protein FWF72_01685 [Paludibacter sp.]|nr:hypothetical protein [Paludibacter sp.]